MRVHVLVPDSEGQGLEGESVRSQLELSQRWASLTAHQGLHAGSLHEMAPPLDQQVGGSVVVK